LPCVGGWVCAVFRAQLASGRDADIFVVDDGLILKRYRRRRGAEHEAAMMRYVSAFGYPVPNVIRVTRSQLVMERVVARPMLEIALERPSVARQFGELLGDLHARLHAIPSTDGATSVVHFDLQPGNVLMADSGPVVIDWVRAGFGEPLDDVACTWLILATGDVRAARPAPASIEYVRAELLAGFTAVVGQEQVMPHLKRVGPVLAMDRNKLLGERAAIKQFLEMCT
jgi:aminoglycoside phosphotransferase (APT) family kinase protein